MEIKDGNRGEQIIISGKLIILGLPLALGLGLGLLLGLGKLEEEKVGSMEEVNLNLNLVKVNQRVGKKIRTNLELLHFFELDLFDGEK